jgi:hypothetical protein
MQDGFDDDPERLQKLYGHAIQWLAAEGFIRIGQIAGQDHGDDVFCGAVLSAKGLESLRKTPGSLAGPGETLGDKIEAAAKDIGTDSAKAAMKQLIPYALGWLKGFI